MSLCHKCSKPVYFAERKTSLGKDWHRGCLQCESCGKVLNPGQHAEHKGIPYCHIPCYSALFGPIMFGHSPAGEVHTNVSRGMERRHRELPVKKDVLLKKLESYNSYHCDSKLKLWSKENGNEFSIEGLLRVYWGVVKPIQLKPQDETAKISSPMMWRKSFPTLGKTTEEEFLKDSNGDHTRGITDIKNIDKSDMSPRYNTFGGSVQYRKKNRKIKRRLSMINGHVYNIETCVFTPAHGCITSVRVNSLNRTTEVIRSLLDKFKVLNNPSEFCLTVVKTSGETKILKETDHPLIERVILGPRDEESQIFIMEKNRGHEIPRDVAQFAGLPEPVLNGFLEKLQSEEEEEIKRLKEKFTKYKSKLRDKLTMMRSSSSV